MFRCLDGIIASSPLHKLLLLLQGRNWSLAPLWKISTYPKEAEVLFSFWSYWILFVTPLHCITLISVLSLPICELCRSRNISWSPSDSQGIAEVLIGSRCLLHICWIKSMNTFMMLYISSSLWHSEYYLFCSKIGMSEDFVTIWAITTLSQKNTH